MGEPAAGSSRAWLLTCCASAALIGCQSNPQFEGDANAIRCQPDRSVVRADGLIGPEDITIDHTSGIAYISADDRWEDRPGGLYRYEPGSFREPERVRILDVPAEHADRFASDFHPHGISIYRGPCTDATCTAGTNTTRLFVINHRIDPETGARQSDVEILELAGNGSLRYVSTIASAAEHENLSWSLDLNNLVAVGSNSFYATDNGRGPISAAIRGTGAVVYYDGTDYHVVVTGLKFANGIAFHPTKNTLFVSTSAGRVLRMFDTLDRYRPVEHEGHRIPLDALLDNIEWESPAHEALLVTGHDSTTTFLRHAWWESKSSPTRVWRIEIRPRGLPKKDWKSVRLLYRHEGETLPAISVAAAYRDRVLLGAVYVDRLMDCGYAL